MKLTTEQYNTLQDIAKKTKADRWFCLKQNGDNEYFIYDLENNMQLSWNIALQWLNEAIIEEDGKLITKQEKEIFKNLWMSLEVYKWNINQFQ